MIPFKVHYNQRFNLQPSAIAKKIHLSLYLLAHVMLCIVNLSGLVRLAALMFLFLYFKKRVIPSILLKQPSSVVSLYFSGEDIKALLASGENIEVNLVTVHPFIPDLIRLSHKHSVKPQFFASLLSRQLWCAVWPDSLSEHEYRLFQMRVNLGFDQWIKQPDE